MISVFMYSCVFLLIISYTKVYLLLFKKKKKNLSQTYFVFHQLVQFLDLLRWP